MLDALQSVFEVDMGLHGWLALGITVVGVIGLNLLLLYLARKPHQDYVRPAEFWREDEDPKRRD